MSLRHIVAFLAGAAIVLGAPFDFHQNDRKGVQASHGDVVPGQYIITFKDGLTQNEVEEHHLRVRSLRRRRGDNDDGSSAGGLARRSFSLGNVETNYVLSGVDAALAAAIGESEEIQHIEEDRYVYLSSVVTEDHVPYGLHTISHHSPANGTFTQYVHDDDAGNGTWAYVVDSGINSGHVDFGGRASFGFNAVRLANSTVTDDDLSGHGTHVAGVILADNWGVSRRAEAIAVKVFDHGSSPISIIMRGYSWAADDIIRNKRARRSVINMSIEATFSPALNKLVDSAAREHDIVTVVAAGNKGVDAAISSPAAAETSITVGAIDERWRIATFSNYGPTVDVFAPGVLIPSTFIGSKGEIKRLNGTSMACPHVSGLVLQFMSLDDVAGPKDVKQRIIDLSTKDRVVGLTGKYRASPNRVAFNGVEKYPYV